MSVTSRYQAMKAIELWEWINTHATARRVQDDELLEDKLDKLHVLLLKLAEANVYEPEIPSDQ